MTSVAASTWGFDAAAIARALEISPDAVEPLLDHARAFLRDRLVESGLVERDVGNRETPRRGD